MSDKTQHSQFPPSSFARFEACPASWSACRGIPSRETEFSMHGTEMHELVARRISGEEIELPEEARKAYDYYLSVCRDDDRPTETEVRVSYRSFSGELYFGTADVVVTRADGSIFLIDWKFGRNPVAAPGNAQLAGYAAALHQERRPPRIDAAIFQPNLSDVPALWEDIDAESETRRVLGIIRRTQAENAQFCPGEHCQYCNAYMDASCPAMRTQALAMAQAVTRRSCPLDIDSLKDATSDRIVAWADAGQMVRKFLDAVDEELRRRCEESGGSCGPWRLQRTAGRVSVTDPQGLYDELSRTVENTVTPGDFLVCCSVTQSKLAALLEQRNGLGKTEAKKAAQQLCETHGTRGAEVIRLTRCKD